MNPRFPRSSLDVLLSAPNFWIGQVIFWGLHATVPIAALRPVLIPDFSDMQSLAGFMAQRLAFGMAASWLLMGFYNRSSIKRLRGINAITARTGACFVLAIGHAVVTDSVVSAVAPACLPFVQPLNVQLSVGFALWLVIWSVLEYGFQELRRLSVAEAAAEHAKLVAAEAALSLKSSELKRLAQHVEPHFLFNALASVVACRRDPERIVEVVEALSDYLRYCLTRSGRAEPLGHELDAVEKFLTVQSARFQQDIDCRIDVTPASRGVLVPPMIIGPLVDNAIKYGRLTSPKPLVILVDARIEGECLLVTVSNTGSWVERSETPGLGTGLDNLRHRLGLADLPGAALTTAAHDGQVVARVRLPLKSPGDEPMCVDRLGAAHSTDARSVAVEAR